MADTMVDTVLPRELRLGVPAKMPQARSYLFRQQATLPTYTYGQTITINVPRLQRSYLRKDSYLRFRLNGYFTPTDKSQSLSLDTAGAWGLFEKLEVFDYLGSTVLETISGKPQLMSLLLDMGLKDVLDKNIGNAVMGLDYDVTTNGDPNFFGSAGGNNSLVNTTSSISQGGYVRPPNSGLTLVVGTEAASTSTTNGVSWTAANPGVFTWTGSNLTAGTAVTLNSLGSNSYTTTGANSVASPSVITWNNGTPTFALGTPIVVVSAGTPGVSPFVAGQTYYVAGTPGAGTFSLAATPGGAAINASGAVSTLNMYVPQPGTTNSALSTGTTYYVASTPAPTANTFALATTVGGTAINTTGAGPNSFAGATVQTSAGTQTAFTREFAIPMLSFMGMLSKKMVPLHNGFTVVLTVASQKKPMVVCQPVEPVIVVTTGGSTSAISRTPTLTTEPTAPTWQLTDVYLECQILELGPIAESMILSSTQGSPLVVHTKAFRNYVATVKGATWAAGTSAAPTTTGQQEFVLNLNLNVASMTNVLWFMRPTVGIDSSLYPSCGARTRNMLQRWQFQYGSTTLPQNNGIQAMSLTAPSFPTGGPASTNTTSYIGYSVGFSECFQELVKSRPIFLDANRFQTDGYLVDSVYNVNLDNRTTNPIPILNWKGLFPSKSSAQPLPRFAAGLNLQLVQGKDGELISGLNTNGMNTSIRGVFNPLYTDYMADATVDAYAEYDAFVNISPGIATTVAF